MTHRTDVPKTSDLAGFAAREAGHDPATRQFHELFDQAAREAGQVPKPPAWVTEYSFVTAEQIHSEEAVVCDSKPRTTADDITDTCDDICKMLIAKNRKYGDSALDPVRIFSKATPVEQILVRLDDKLSRLRSAQADEDEDVIDDLIGYLVLLKIARLR